MPLTRCQSWARAVFEGALHLYPAAYREEYGREMTLVFMDRLRETSGLLRAWTALGAIVSLMMDAPGQHLQVLDQDLRVAVRLLRREKGFAIAAIGTLALGIGLSSAVFSMGKLLLIDPLPYREADRAAMVWVTNPRQGFERDFTSYPRLVEWRERSRLIETLAAYAFRRPVATFMRDPEQLRVVRATPELFSVVQTEPVVGRVFAPTEEQASVVVLSHGLWQRKFGGQWTAVGQTLRLDAVPYTVIGVLPRSFRFPERGVDAWVPLQPSAEERQSGAFWLRTVARLEPGVSLAQAQEEMSAIALRLGDERPDDRDLGVALVGLRDEFARPFKPALLMLSAAVLGVLLIACVNVAGMLTARSADRRRARRLQAPHRAAIAHRSGGPLPARRPARRRHRLGRASAIAAGGTADALVASRSVARRAHARVRDRHGRHDRPAVRRGAQLEGLGGRRRRGHGERNQGGRSRRAVATLQAHARDLRDGGGDADRLLDEPD